jgi:hemin uptake protein HemP
MRHESLSATTATAMSDARPVSQHLKLPQSPTPPQHDARALTGGGSQAEIRLDGVRYLLRITRQGKLILTK